MAETIINRWALGNYKGLTVETVLAIFDEVEAGIADIRKRHVLTSPSDVYALASRFRNTLYRFPFFKKKHLKILRAVIDRCGEAYYKKDLSILNISKDTVHEWSRVFRIPENKIRSYLYPLLRFGILRSSNNPRYVYVVDSNFFELMGPVAQYLVRPVDTRRFAEMMAVASGISSIYVVATSAKSRKFGESRPVIPWFLKLSMIYTLAGLEGESMRIGDVLELDRINAVDNYFVLEREAPVEWWRSVRAEAFEYMADNDVIEQAVPIGYRLNKLWVRMHEEGVRRYVQRLRKRYERRYRGF